MSKERLKSNGSRWLRQALDDASASEALLAAAKYAQSCFWSQQSAEKALKAVWILLDLDPWGHSVTRLITDLDAPHRTAFADLREAALHLDKLYIPTRYPDALAELTPGEAYTEAEARTALSHTRRIISRVQEWMDREDRPA